MIRHLLGAALSTAILLTGVAASADHEPGHDPHLEEVKLPSQAVCVLSPTEGNNVRGTFLLYEKEGKLHLVGKVTGLTPGLHGFHIHEFGDLTSADGTAAGGHYNPDGHDHAGPEDETQHAGDLGNIEADQSGVANVRMAVGFVKLHTIFGRSLVVHADADDLKSQPAGDAGPRVAVGVIGVANPKHFEPKAE